MTNQEICEVMGLSVSGQQFLFPDFDYVLRHSLFCDTGNRETNQRAITYWWMRAYIPNGNGFNNTPLNVYSSWNNAVYQNFKYITMGGYNTQTNQSTVSIKCNHSDDTEAHLNELMLFLPLIKESSYKDITGKRIGILEHMLSEFASWGIWVKSDDSVIIDKWRHHAYSIESRFPCLTPAIDFIKMNLWYDGYDSSDDDEWYANNSNW